MPLIPTFTDFLVGTKTHKITSPTDILNEAVKRTYFLAEMVKGKDVGEIVRTGQSIKDTIQLHDGGSFQFYSPHARLDPIDVDTLQDVEIGWRFACTHYAYSDEIIGLNEGNGEDVYVSLKKKYRQQAMTDLWNGMEEALWAVPNAASMEAGSGTDPVSYSIWALVNDQANGLASGFTTKFGINPTTEDRWRPNLATYDAGNLGDETNGLFAAFDEMWLECRFEAPDTKEDYFENDRLRKMKIVTNKDGMKKYRQQLRAANDRLVSPQDPAYNAPVYSGIPVKYVAQLDSALLDSGSAWAAGEPRFLWLNLEYLFPIWHAKGYMEQVGPKDGGMNQPFSSAVFYRTWFNLFARSLQRHGCIYPAA